MKTFLKRAAITTGLLFTALICCAIVYIDTTQNYWYVNSGFVKLIVSNQTGQAIMTVDTNTLRVGFNTNNTSRSFQVVGQKPATNAAGNGTGATTTGLILLVGGPGGESTLPTSATGGAAGGVNFAGGVGGSAEAATTNATGGVGGTVVLLSGVGGAGAAATGLATNAATGGAGGLVTITAAAGGAPGAPATNTVGGAGGNMSINAGNGGTPSAGWARKGGNGGNYTFTAGVGADSIRTNGGNGGSFTMLAGSSGSASTTPGNAGSPGNMIVTAGSSGSAVAGGTPEPGGQVRITGGNGSTGDTNSDGGHVFIAGGAPGSGAVPGNVVLARTSTGTSRGAGVQIGPLLAGSATITNVLGGSASLDFGSVAAGTVEDLPITVTGVTSNNCAVALSVAWMALSGNGGVFSTYNSNDAVFVRFANNNLVTAIDPPPFTATVVAFRVR